MNGPAPPDQPGRARPGQMLGRERWAILLLAASGAAFLPGALDRFVFPKLALAAAGVALALSVPSRGALPPPVKWLLAVAGAILLGGALAGAAPVAQLVGRPPRYEGVIGVSLYLGVLVAGARLLGPARARGSTAWLLDCLSVLGIAIGLEAALEAAGLRPLISDVSRPGSLLGNASDQGAWAVLALGPLVAAALRPRGTLHRAGAIGAAVALGTSGSRGALAGAFVTAVVLSALTPGRRQRLVLAGGCAVLAAGVLALPATRNRVLTRTQISQQTVTGRELLWGETLELVRDHPLLGAGPGGFVDAIPVYHTRRYESEIGPANPPDSPTDWILQAAVAGGIGLAVIALGLAGVVLWRGVRALETQPTAGEAAAIGGLLAGLAGYTVALLFYFTSPGTTPLAALFAGALVAAHRDRAGPGVSWLRWAATVAYASLTVVLVAGAIAEVPLRSALLDAAAGNLAGANRQFDLARDLRPWDGGVAEAAAHAYAVLAAQGVARAGGYGLPWARRELDAYPNSIQALEDAATLQTTSGRPGGAARLLSRARRLEPANPQP